MKRKVIYIFFIMLFALLMFSCMVEAKTPLTIDKARDMMPDGDRIQGCVEIVDYDSEKEKESSSSLFGPYLCALNFTDTINYASYLSYNFGKNDDVPKKFWIHVFVQRAWSYWLGASASVEDVSLIRWVPCVD